MKQTEDIRKFNRYYARILDVFSTHMFETELTLTEARVIGEIARNPDISAYAIAKYLNLDSSYLSRIINRFEKAGLLIRKSSTVDKRRKTLLLTDEGLGICSYLNKQSDAQIDEMLEKLEEEEREQLVQAMRTIEKILKTEVDNNENYGRDTISE